MAIHFITYGNDSYAKSKERLVNEANNIGWFETSRSYGPEDLDEEFVKKFKYILDYKRGGGYWLWKPYIIK